MSKKILLSSLLYLSFTCIFADSAEIAKESIEYSLTEKNRDSHKIFKVK